MKTEIRERERGWRGWLELTADRMTWVAGNGARLNRARLKVNEE